MKNNLKILHIGNIAANGYLNTKFLRKRGWKVDLISHDYYDLFSTPEWLDGKLTKKDFNQTKNIEGIDPEFKRPDWYLSGALRVIAQKNYGFKDTFTSKSISHNQKFQFFNHLVERIDYRWINNMWGELNKNFNPYHKYINFREYSYWRRLIKLFNKIYPERSDQLSFDDMMPYTEDVRAFKTIFNNYQLVHCYSTEPIFALLSGKRPYIAYEHGTLRDIPFENSPRGRLTALSYKLADLVFITNADNINAAKRLKLNNYQSIPHPIDNKWYKKNDEKILNNKERLIFCPTRHDWEHKNIHFFIKALSQVKKKSPISFKVIFLEWGQEIKRSKNLIKKLGIQKICHFQKPLTRYELAKMMKKADIIFDQAFWKSMGGISAEGLMAGKPVLTSYDAKLCQWMFPEKPPLIAVFSPAEIAAALLQLLKNPKKAELIGKSSKEWFNKNHSEKVVASKLIKGYNKVLTKYGI